MTYPTLAVKVSFGTDRFDTPSYSTLPAADVEGLHIDIGRHSELDGLDAGSIDVALDNSSRNYDPHNTSGTHYPDVTPGRKVQITATYSGQTYQIANGWTDSWPQTSSRKMASTTLKASGPFRFLARDKIDDVYADAVLADSPSAYYRLGDSKAHTLSDSSGNGHHGFWTPEFIDVGTSGALIDSADAATELPSLPTRAVAVIPSTVLSTLRGFSIEWWSRFDKIPEQSALGVPELPLTDTPALLLDGGGVQVALGSDASPYAGALLVMVQQAPLLSGGGVPINITSTINEPDGVPRTVCDGVAHHVVFTFNTGGTAGEIWVDGDLAGTPSSIVYTIANVAPFGPFRLNEAGAWGGGAVVDELAFYDTPLTFSQIAAHRAAGLRAGAGDLTGDRISRVLDLIDWPATLRDITSGQTILSESKAVGEVPLTYLRLVAETEQGVLSEGHDDDGKIRFQDRSGRLSDPRSATVQTLFSDDPTDIASNNAVVYTDVGLPTDDRPVANIVTVQWPGTEVVATDQASVDTYGEIPHSVDTILTSRDEAENLALWLLDEQSAATANRVQSVTLTPSAMNGTAADRAWTACLKSKVGDRVQVRHTPTGSGTEIDHEAWIIGIEHKADSGAGHWETVLRLAPATTASYWLLGTSQLGTDTRLMF